MECNHGCKKKSKLNKKVEAILKLREIKPLQISTTCDCKDCRYKGYMVCKECSRNRKYKDYYTPRKTKLPCSHTWALVNSIGKIDYYECIHCEEKKVVEKGRWNPYMDKNK